MNKKKVRTGIAERLRALRLKMGLSRDDVAARIGEKERTYKNWEDSTDPPLSALENLSKCFGVSIAYLVTGRDESKDAANVSANVSGPITMRDTGDNSVNVAGSGNTVTPPPKHDAEAAIAEKDAVIDRLTRIIAQLTEPKKPAAKKRSKV